VSFSIPETARHLRQDLRTLLQRAGMAPLSNGTWIGPEVVITLVRRFLDLSGLGATPTSSWRTTRS
jgi:DNA-binding transcriptional regulator PaaX